MAAVCAGLFVIVLCTDMGIKQYVEDTFRCGEEKETLIPGIVMRKVSNRGFAFHILEKRPEIVKYASLFVGGVILLYDVYLMFRKKRYVRKIGMTLVTAGAVSNTYDRVVRGKVIDYLGYKGKGKKEEEKEAFFSGITVNLADLFLFAGAVMADVSRGWEKRKKAKKVKARKSRA